MSFFGVAVFAPETTVTYAASQTWNLDTDPIAKVTLTGNITLTVANGVAGRQYRIAIIQDGTGSRTVTLAGCTTLGTPTWATAAGGVNFVTIYLSGSTRYAVVV